MATGLPMVLLRLILAVLPALGVAAELTGVVRDDGGSALPEAVASLEPLDGKPVETSRPQTVTMDQVEKEFVSHILAIRTGTAVRFPNSDKIKHHVYSFSPSHPFEIKLYAGTPASPVTFDKPGVVTLGCNIHDWMVAYIYVTSSPYFKQADSQGRWSLTVPDGRYRLTVWHPDAVEAMVKTVDVHGKAPNSLELALAMKPGRRLGKPPKTAQERGYSGDP